MKINRRFVRRFRRNPTVFSTLWRLRECREFERRVLRSSDHLVIEGYPRSANTFAVEAFRFANKKTLKIGNHFHAVAQIKLAGDYGIPAMVLIREPVAAALSFVVYHNGRLSVIEALRIYVEFYEPLIGMSDFYVPAPFEEVTTDFSTSIRRLNRRFGTSFLPFEHTAENQRLVYERVERKRLERVRRTEDRESEARKTVPSKEKESMRLRYVNEFEKAYVSDLRQKACEIYSKILAHPSLLEVVTP